MVTQEQYERWKDFALRMARTCFKRRRNPTWKDIETNVGFFFGQLEYNDLEDLKCIVDWDKSEPYPPDSRFYLRTYKCPCWHCHGTKQDGCRWNCEDGHIYDYAAPYCVGDMLSEKAEVFNLYYWAELSDAKWWQRDEQFCGPVRCCIRAGLDMAVAPSAGVIGFTAGDLRKMYPGGVPKWITGGDERWKKWPSGEENGTFAEMPDEAGVVL